MNSSTISAGHHMLVDPCKAILGNLGLGETNATIESKLKHLLHEQLLIPTEGIRTMSAFLNRKNENMATIIFKHPGDISFVDTALRSRPQSWLQGKHVWCSVAKPRNGPSAYKVLQRALQEIKTMEAEIFAANALSISHCTDTNCIKAGDNAVFRATGSAQLWTEKGQERYRSEYRSFIDDVVRQ